MSQSSKHPVVSPMNTRLDRRYLWIGLAIFTFLVNILLKWNPAFTEIAYSRGLFMLFRSVWDYTLGWAPFPLLYLAIPLILFLFFKKGRLALKNYGKVKWRYRIGSAIFSIIAFVAIIYTLFQWMWGFNYYRVSVEQKLGLSSYQADSTSLILETREVLDLMERQRSAIPSVSDSSLDYTLLPVSMEGHLRTVLKSALKEYGYPVSGRVRARLIRPDGSMMRLGALGIYIPFLGEGHVDAALPAVSRPFTLAHEMTHGYGFGDEGTANFWAYLATQKSDYPIVQYSGSLAYFRYLMREIMISSPRSYQSIATQLSTGIKSDLQSIRKSYQVNREFFPRFNAVTYDQYLKSQGISEGRRSYNKMVRMLMALKSKNP